MTNDKATSSFINGDKVTFEDQRWVYFYVGPSSKLPGFSVVEDEYGAVYSFPDWRLYKT